MNDEMDGRPRRIKGSDDHDWKAWRDTQLGRGRTCKRCGREDDGYQQPCKLPEAGNMAASVFNRILDHNMSKWSTTLERLNDA